MLGKRVFERADLNLFYETEVQSQLAARAALVFPGYHYARFNVPIQSPHGVRKADFVLVDRGYRTWYVGEVERIGHSLYDHVVPQGVRS